MLVVAMPFPFVGGGGLRAYRSLRRYIKYGFNIYLHLPFGIYQAVIFNKEATLKHLKHLKIMGVKFAGFSYPIDIARNLMPKRVDLYIKSILPSISPSLFTGFRNVVENEEISLVMSLHEPLDSLYATIKLSERLGNVKTIALLQLPPLYGSKKRVENILTTMKIWYWATLDNCYERLLALLRLNIKNSAERKHMLDILDRITYFIAISKAIFEEMGEGFRGRRYAFDPGVSLNEEDVAIINSFSGCEKKDIIVFGGRPSAEKGLIEGLLAFKSLSKKYNNMKLYITGNISETLIARLKNFCKKLGIENKVIFTGFVPRAERFRIISQAKLMLYPSHVDGFPYAVLESLYLGTPIVGYNIPALRIYYSELGGVKLVKELDIEALSIEAINAIESKLYREVEKPEIKSWNDIMNEETSLIEKLALE